MNLPICRRSVSRMRILNSYLLMSFRRFLFYYPMASTVAGKNSDIIIFCILQVTYPFWVLLRSSFCVLCHSVSVKYYNGMYFTDPVCLSYIHGKIAFIILKNFRHYLFKYCLHFLSSLFFHLNSDQICQTFIYLPSIFFPLCSMWVVSSETFSSL